MFLRTVYSEPVNNKKTEHMRCIFDRLTDVNSVKFKIGNNELRTADPYKYLERVLSPDGRIDAEQIPELNGQA